VILKIVPDTELPEDNIKLSSLQEKLNAAMVTAAEYIEVPPICFEIKDGELSSEIGTLGNISLFIGKAKQGKTFAVSMALAAANIGEWLMDKIKVSLPDDKRTVILFDTEQSKYHVQRVVKRIGKLSNTFEPENLITYGLRGYNSGECLELVEYAIYNTDNVGFVVIDGIRDLVTSINDEEQASSISAKLLKWSQDRNIHIINVLHMNKGDSNARGHLGTELTNKSESVVSIGKDPENKEQILVSPEYCRNREFEQFAFKIDDFGIPYIVEIEALAKAPKKALTPMDIDASTHTLVLDNVFRLKSEYRYKELADQVKDYFMRYGIKFGDNKAREFITFYQNDLWVDVKTPEKGYPYYIRLKKETVQKPVLNAVNYVNNDFNTLSNEAPF
jgi:hypothetical protein